MIKAVIFDMDGLMFDTEFLVIKGWDYAGEKLGYGKLGYMIYKAIGTNSQKTKEIFYEEFGDKVDVDKLTECTREFVYKYYEENGVPEKPYLHEAIEFLHNSGYKLAVASSSRRQTVESHIKGAGLIDYFNAIVCGDMITKSKPDPEIYLKAAQELNVKPEECIALEDSPNGIKSAYNANMQVIMIPDLVKPTEEIKKLITTELKDLGEFISFVKEKYN